ncbi:MAG: hypothetical protein HY247_05780 [archaeon]|nr:MAG: hypothetical protein HY247_05780 [archaeon]
MGVLTALYVAANAVPIDAFIGGAGFITAGILILPVIARLVRPMEAVVVGIAAPLGLFAFQLSVIPIFGFYGMLIPASAIVLGSLGFYKSYLVPTAYIVLGAFWYLAFSGGTIVWLAPYVLAVSLVIVNQVRPFVRGTRAEVLLFCFLTTMCEQVTMNIGSVSLLQLPGFLWTVIAPFMFLERTVAVVGSSSVLIALIRVKSALRMAEI